MAVESAQPPPHHGSWDYSRERDGSYRRGDDNRYGYGYGYSSAGGSYARGGGASRNDGGGYGYSSTGYHNRP
jgi:hypothetical protein